MMAPPEPTPYRPDSYDDRRRRTLGWVEHRLNSVVLAADVLVHWKSWKAIPRATIRFNHHTAFTGDATALTRGALEIGLIHSRALLEFLGLKGEDEWSLKERKGKRPDDRVIEDIAGLHKCVVANLPDDCEPSFAHVIHMTDKQLAHITSRFIPHEDRAQFIETTFRELPKLVWQKVYVPLGRPPPEFPFTYSRKRA